MATKARQQYFADEISLQKDSREFSLEDNVKQKIDSVEAGAQVNTIETVKVNGTALTPDANKAVNVEVPDVIDNLYSTSTDDALSAKQGKVLYDYLQNIASRGRFLSNWNSATGLPMTNPSESPYPYKSGDYFNVSNVAGLGGTNYRPDGSSYIIGQASTVVETEDVSVSDFYFYDGTNWLLLSNSGRQIAVDSSLSTTSTNPVENRVVTNAINGKQDTLIAGTNVQIAADGKTISATDTTYSAGTNISIDANNEISAVDTTYTAGTNVQISNQNVISATDTKYTAGDGINIDANNEISNTLPGAIVSATAPSNPTEGMFWYDTANDELKTYNGTAWQTEGTKMVVLEYGVSTWQDFIDAYNENAIVYCKVSSGSSGYRMAFMAYTAGQGTPTEVEFQYYRSRSAHSQSSTQLDEVYVYKLTNAGVWTTTQRDTGAEMIAGTGIGITFNSSGATINNTGVTSVNGNTGTVTVEEVPSGGTEGQVLTQTSNGPAWQNPTGGAEIEYKTQAEYDALPSSKLTDGKHYFIYSTSGGGGGWQPGANTIAYYPFTSTDTIQDKSGNGNNLTNSGATFQTFNGVDCMFCDGTTKSVSGNITGIPQGANVRTFNFWCYNNQATALSGIESYFIYGTEDTNKLVMLLCGDNKSTDTITQYGTGGQLGTTLRSQWFNLCLVYDGSKFIEYINGSYVGDWTYTINTTGTSFKIYGRSGWSNGSKYYSNFIIEDKARTAQEISDYFDQTKADYGIS